MDFHYGIKVAGIEIIKVLYTHFNDHNEASGGNLIGFYFIAPFLIASSISSKDLVFPVYFKQEAT